MKAFNVPKGATNIFEIERIGHQLALNLCQIPPKI
jgi:hypothetical protein